MDIFPLFSDILQFLCSIKNWVELVLKTSYQWFHVRGKSLVGKLMRGNLQGNVCEKGRYRFCVVQGNQSCPATDKKEKLHSSVDDSYMAC